MAFRNKVSTFWSDLFAHLKTLKNTVGDNSTLSILEVAEGESPLTFYPIPYVLVQMIGIRVVHRADGDKQWLGKIKIRIVSRITSTEGMTIEALSKIAQVENKFDAYVKPDGVEGLENAEWSIASQTSPDAGNLVMCDSARDFTIVVSKGAN